MMAGLRLIRIAGLLVAALIATVGQAFALPPRDVDFSQLGEHFGTKFMSWYLQHHHHRYQL